MVRDVRCGAPTTFRRCRGNPTTGTFDLLIWDGTQTITVTAIANTVTAAASRHVDRGGAGRSGLHRRLRSSVAWRPVEHDADHDHVQRHEHGGSTVRDADQDGDTTSPAVTITNTTPGGARNKHTFNPSATAGHWATFVRSVGTGTVTRHSLIDCLIGGFTLEASQAQKDMRITPNLLSLDPYKVLTADPAATLPTGMDARPFIYTEASGAFTLGTGISSTVISGQSSVTLTVNEDRSPAYGDDVVPYDFSVGSPTVAVSITFIFDGVGLARWNELIYGTAAPTAGTKPLREPAGCRFLHGRLEAEGLQGAT
jgi:hypothetical protein